MHEKRLVRYRSVGLVDLGVGLGSPSPLVLKAADRLDLLLGDRIWPMRGRAGGLPFYGQPYRAGLPEHLGWGLSPDRLTQWRPALWPNPDGSPRELWAVRGGKIERLHVSHEGSWRVDSMGSARFPDPDTTKGLGTVRMTVSAATSEQRMAFRARVVLAAAEGIRPVEWTFVGRGIGCRLR